MKTTRELSKMTPKQLEREATKLIENNATRFVYGRDGAPSRDQQKRAQAYREAGKFRGGR